MQCLADRHRDGIVVLKGRIGTRYRLGGGLACGGSGGVGNIDGEAGCGHVRRRCGRGAGSGAHAPQLASTIFFQLRQQVPRWRRGRLTCLLQLLREIKV